MRKKAQISFEYMILMGFLVFIVILILGIALLYASSIRDRIKLAQLNNFANKVVSTAETVFYAGEPSRATITGYLPDNVNGISIEEDTLIFTIQTSSGVSTIPFTLNVPSVLEGFSSFSGLRRVQFDARFDGMGGYEVAISDAISEA